MLRVSLLWLVPTLASGKHGKVWRKDAIESATAEAVKMVDKLQGACGVSAVDLPGSGFVEPESMSARCWVEQYTNCSMSYTQISCPDECPMVAPSPNFPCIFNCVTPEECAEYSRGNARPDLNGKICEPCDLLGCRYCESRTKCRTCFKGFVLENDQCIFFLDSNGISAAVMQTLLIIIVGLVLTVLVCYLRGKKSPHAEENLQNMINARRQRRLCKLHRWDRTSDKAPRMWRDLSVSMMTDDVSGVGVALYYKRTQHLFVCAVVTFCCLCMLYKPAGLRQYLPTEEDELVSSMLEAFRESLTAPAVLYSPLVNCPSFTPELEVATLQKFASNSFWTLCVLFWALFVISLQQGRSCLNFFIEFDEMNVDSSDYALLLTGLPSSMTHEKQLKDMLQRQLSKHVKLEDNAIHGVSIAYDLSDFTLRSEIEDILANITRRKEEELGAFDNQGEAVKMDWERQKAIDKAKAEAWFNEGKLTSVGRAFVVFSKASTRDEVLTAYSKDAKVIQMPELPDVALESVDFDPVSVFWENQQNSEEHVIRASVKGALRVVLFFLTVNALIIIPYNVFVVGAFMSSGANLAGPSQTMAGLLLGIVNQQISAQVYNQAYFAGFKKKDRFDTFIFVLNTVVQFFNTWISLGVTAWAVIGKEGGRMSLFQPLADAGNIGLEAAIGDAFYAMHVPGVLYVNYIMGLVMGGVVPFTQHTLVGKIIYVWRSLPDCLLYALKIILPWSPDDLDRYPRFNAEKAIEAPEMGVAWDYSAFIVHMATAFLVTAVVSASVWKLFLALTCWCVFFHVWSRFMHLRVQTASSFNGHMLDTAAWLLWSLPMGCLAGSAFVWAVRAQMVPEMPLYFHIILLVLVMILAGALWVLSYYLVVRPDRRCDARASQSETVEEVMQHQVFSWYNCNPAYVLKQAYLKDHVPESHLVSDSEAILYRRGKEYLFIPGDKQHKITERFQDMWEFETHLEWLFEQLGNITVSRSASRRDLEKGPQEDKKYAPLRTEEA